jgi:glycosyltransferase involved in cell wall biosynthesis
MSAAKPAGDVPVSVIILTKNEEKNIARALATTLGWAHQVFVFDSFSTDRTVEIATSMGADVVQHVFVDYAQQRAAALVELPLETEWVFFLDADEQLPPELRSEIAAVIARDPVENGFYCRFRMIWMGRWIRRGYYPTWIMRFFRRSKGTMESRAINEHFKIEGATGRLENDILHEDNKSIDEWIDKHNRYSSGEARELFEGATAGEIVPRLFGTQTERKRWIRYRVWNRLPPLVRPSIYFAWRYVVRGGFLEGKEALSYHFLHALWFYMLVDIKYLDMKRRRGA